MHSFRRFIPFLIVFVAGCGSGAKTPPATPDAAVTDVAKGLAQDKPEVVWQALPDSYQKDVNGLITTFANGCDQDLYNQGFGIAKKVVQVLQKKKDMIITHPLLAQTGKQQELAQNWDTVVNALAVVTNSEVSDLNKVKTLDVEKFLSGTGSQFMKACQELAKLAPQKPGTPDFKTMMNGVKATVVKTEGDTATVKIEPPGEAAKEMPFKKVEGKWVPKEMADDWSADIAKAKAELQKAIDTGKAKNKDLTLSQLKTIDAALDQMLAAKTAQEFNSAAEAAAGTVFMIASTLSPQPGMGAPSAHPAPPKPKPADGEDKDEEEEEGK